MHLAQIPNGEGMIKMLHRYGHTKRHFVCREDLSDEDREGYASRGVFGLSSLQNYIIDDCREIDLRPLNNVVYEVGCLEGEIILVGHRNKVVGEYTPVEFN